MTELKENKVRDFLPWVFLGLSALAYYLIFQLDFFAAESVQSSYLLQCLATGAVRIDSVLLDSQPLGVRILLGGVSVTPAADIIFKVLAALQSLCTLAFAAHTFKRYFRWPVVIAGALLFVHFTWPGAFALLPFSWLGPLSIAFMYHLTGETRPVSLGVVLILTATFCPPLLLIQLLVLLLWLMGKGIRELDRPLLVRSTLNIDSVLSKSYWLRIAVAALLAAVIAYFSFVPFAFDGAGVSYQTALLEGAIPSYTGSFSPESFLMDLFDEVPASILFLPVGTFILGWKVGAGFRRPANYLLALLIAGGVYNAAYGYALEIRLGYNAVSYALVVFAPTLLILLVGFADSYFTSPWVSILSVLLLLSWIPLYAPM